MKALATLALCLLPAIAAAQQPAPGWIPTGEWQCGPHVRVIVSIDGYGAMNFNVIGAWFDNNYTVRRGALFAGDGPGATITQRHCENVSAGWTEQGDEISAGDFHVRPRIGQGGARDDQFCAGSI